MDGVTYYGGEEERFYRSVRKYMKENPEGPYVYSLWSDIPDDPEEETKWAHYLSLYRPMVTENSVVYVDVKESGFLATGKPEHTCLSVFANEEIYMTLSNYDEAERTFSLKDAWLDRESGERGTEFSVKPNAIRFLQKV